MGTHKGSKGIGSLQDPPNIDGSSVPLLWTLEEDGRVYEVHSGELERPPQHGAQAKETERVCVCVGRSADRWKNRPLLFDVLLSDFRYAECLSYVVQVFDLISVEKTKGAKNETEENGIVSLVGGLVFSAPFPALFFFHSYSRLLMSS
jgi:hypothetical protein